MRVLVSGCLAGLPCGVDGTDYGLGGCLDALLSLPTLSVSSFCPEKEGLGVPRTTPDIHGGDGFSVLEGEARILDEHGSDLTAKMLLGAEAMLTFARQKEIELAILTDMSAACATQVLSDGCRLVDHRRFRAGVGVAAALLLRDGFPVVSQRDFRTLARIRAFLDPGFQVHPSLVDHHQTEWYQQEFDAPQDGVGR